MKLYEILKCLEDARLDIKVIEKNDDICTIILSDKTNVIILGSEIKVDGLNEKYVNYVLDNYNDNIDSIKFLTKLEWFAGKYLSGADYIHNDEKALATECFNIAEEMLIESELRKAKSLIIDFNYSKIGEK